MQTSKLYLLICILSIAFISCKEKNSQNTERETREPVHLQFGNPERERQKRDLEFQLDVDQLEDRISPAENKRAKEKLQNMKTEDMLEIRSSSELTK